MQTSIGAMFRATFNTSETLPLGDDGPGRVVTAGSNVDVRLPVSAPWRSVTTDLPATLPLKATTPSAGAMMASCGRARKSKPRCPGNHCLAGASYSPITCACSKGHCIDVRHAACATSCATSSADCAYADAVGCAQHIVNAIFANTHTAIAAAHRCRLRLSMSSDILLCRTRRRYSHLFMRPPVVRVSIGESISWHVRRPPVDLERPCGRRTTLIHRCRACRAMTCQNATERGIRWDA